MKSIDRTCEGHISNFQARIYELLSKVPPGTVTTYGRLAKAAGCRSARAVGRALRSNPFSPAVPCHRVIAADLSPGGFYGSTSHRQVTRKIRLLEAEGVRFDGLRLAETCRLYDFPEVPEIDLPEAG